MNWLCMCGHVNGPDLATCAMCFRNPSEGKATPHDYGFLCSAALASRDAVIERLVRSLRGPVSSPLNAENPAWRDDARAALDAARQLREGK